MYQYECAIIWIVISLTVVVFIISLLLSYNFIFEERYWPEPYFMGNYTQNDRERYFDYNPLLAIYKKIDYGKL